LQSLEVSAAALGSTPGERVVVLLSAVLAVVGARLGGRCLGARLLLLLLLGMMGLAVLAVLATVVRLGVVGFARIPAIKRQYIHSDRYYRVTADRGY
jgi:hypothetical protein